MEIINTKDLPYTFDIKDNMQLKIVTKEIPTGELKWTKYKSNDGSKTFLSQSFELNIPGGITAVQIFLSQNDGSPAANIRIQNFHSKKYWFDNVNTDTMSYPIIKVNQYQKYLLMIDEITELPRGGTLKFRFGNDINKATPDLIDI